MNELIFKSIRLELLIVTHVSYCAHTALDCLPFWHLFCKSQIRYSHMPCNKQIKMYRELASNSDY